MGNTNCSLFACMEKWMDAKSRRVGRETMAIEVPVEMDVYGTPRLLRDHAWEHASLLRENQECFVHLFASSLSAT
jgi:hypothetical protein